MAKRTHAPSETNTKPRKNPASDVASTQTDDVTTAATRSEASVPSDLVKASAKSKTKPKTEPQNQPKTQADDEEVAQQTAQQTTQSTVEPAAPMSAQAPARNTDLVLAQANTSDKSTSTPTSVGEELFRQAGPLPNKAATAISDFFFSSWGMPVAVGVGALALSGGGGGGSTPPGDYYTITTVPVAGTFLKTASVQVKAYKLVDGTWQSLTVASSSFDDKGQLTLKVNKADLQATDLVKLEVQDMAGSGADYVDEVTGENTQLGKTLSAVVGVITGNTTVTINPLTDLAATKIAAAGPVTAENIALINKAVATAFGISSGELIRTVPKVVTDASYVNSADTDAKNYGVALGILSGMVQTEIKANPSLTSGEALANVLTQLAAQSSLHADKSVLDIASNPALQTALEKGALNLKSTTAVTTYASLAEVTLDTSEKPAAGQTVPTDIDKSVSFYNFIAGSSSTSSTSSPEPSGLKLKLTPAANAKVGDVFLINFYPLKEDGTLKTDGKPYTVRHTYTQTDFDTVNSIAGAGKFSLTIEPYNNAPGIPSNTPMPSDGTSNVFLLPVNAEGRYITDGTVYNYLVTASGSAVGLPGVGTRISIATAPVVIDAAPVLVTAAPESTKTFSLAEFGGTKLITVDVILPQKISWDAGAPTLTLTVTDATGASHDLTATYRVPSKTGAVDALQFECDVRSTQLEGVLSVSANALNFGKSVNLFDDAGNLLFQSDASGAWTKAADASAVVDIAQALGLSTVMGGDFRVDTVRPIDPVLNLTATSIAGMNPDTGLAVDGYAAPVSGSLNPAVDQAFGYGTHKAITNNLKPEFTVSFVGDVSKDVGATVQLMATFGSYGDSLMAQTTIQADGKAYFKADSYTPTGQALLSSALIAESSKKISPNLAGLDVTFTAVVIDKAGNQSTRTALLQKSGGGLVDTIHFDTVAPNVASSVALSPSSDTAPITSDTTSVAVAGASTDGITSDTTPTIIVKGELGTLAKLYDDNGSGDVTQLTPIASGWIRDGGVSGVSGFAVALTPTTPLPAGQRTLLVTLTDQAGNVKIGANGKPLTQAVSVNIWTPLEVEPIVAISSSPSHAGYYIKGENITVSVTFDREVYLVAGQDPNAMTVVLSTGVGSDDTRTATYVEGVGTKVLTFKYTLGSVTGKVDDSLDSGYTIHALNGVKDVLQDLAGNPMPTIGSFTAPATAQKVDVTPPVNPVIELAPVVTNHADKASAASATVDGAVSVKAEAGSQVTVTFKNNSADTTVDVPITGAGTATAVPVKLTASQLALLGDGVLTVTAVSKDAAGNSASSVGSTTFTLDTHAPYVMQVSDDQANPVMGGFADYNVTTGKFKPLVFTVKLSEALSTETPLTKDYFAANNATVDSVELDTSVAGNTTYKVTVTINSDVQGGTTPSSGDKVYLTLHGKGTDGSKPALTDTAGNLVDTRTANAGIDLSAYSQAIDTKGPTPTVTLASSDHVAKSSSFKFIVAFDEALDGGVVLTPSNFTLAVKDGAGNVIGDGASITQVARITGTNTYEVTVQSNGSNLNSDTATVTLGFERESGLDNGLVQDSLGNLAVDVPAFTATQTIDAAAPTILSFSSSTPDGSYEQGGLINIQATASEKLKAGSQITATLDTGDQVLLTLDASDTAGTMFKGTYTVGAGKTSSDLTVTGFALGDTTNAGANAPIDMAGNAMVSTTVPTGTNNIAGAKAIVIDTMAPTITAAVVSGVDSSNAAKTTTLKAGDKVQVVLTSSEALAGWSAGDKVNLTLDNGAGTVQTRDATYVSSAGNDHTFRYTVAANDLDTTSGIVLGALTVNADVKDTAGNALNTTLTSLTTTNTVAVDAVLPTIQSFSTTTVNGSYKEGSSIDIRATASESLQVGAIITVTLNTGETVVLTRDASNAQLLIGTYTVGAGKTSSDLTVTGFALGDTTNAGANAPIDMAGNAMVSTTVPTGTNNIAGAKAIVIDTTAPTITAAVVSGVDSSNAAKTTTLKAGDKVQVMLTSSEALAGWSAGDKVNLTLDNGGGTVQTRDATYVSSAGNQHTFRYTLDNPDLDTAGGVVLGNLTVSANVKDAAGNAVVVTLPAQTNAIAIDAVAPTATATIVALSADTGSSVSDFQTVTANQTVSGTYTGTLGTGEAIEVSANGSTWVRAVVTPAASGGTWSASGVTLVSGIGQQLQVRTVDSVGNTTSGSGKAYTLDASTPSALTGLDFDESQDKMNIVQYESGGNFTSADLKLARDYKTAIQTPRFNFSGGTVGNTAVLFRDLNGNNALDASDTVLGTASIAASGNYVDVRNTQALANATYTDIKVVQQTTAGATSTASNAALSSRGTGLVITSTATLAALTSVSTPAPTALNSNKTIDFIVEGAKSGATITITATKDGASTPTTLGSGTLDPWGKLTLNVGALNGSYTNFKATQTYAGLTSVAVDVKDANSASANYTTVWDHSALTVDSFVLASPSATPPAKGAGFEVLITFNKAITLPIAGTEIAIAGGKLTGMLLKEGTTSTYIATFTPTDASQTSVTFSLPANTFADALRHQSEVSAALTYNYNRDPGGAVTLTGATGASSAPKQGDTLTVVTSGITDADGNIKSPNYTYKWFAADDAAGTNKTAIAGATTNTLQLAQAQVGKAITVEVNYTDDRGTPEKISSTATALVINTNDTPVGKPTFTVTRSGAAFTPSDTAALQAEDVLTADITGLTDADNQTASNATGRLDASANQVRYTWQSSANDSIWSDISGAASSTYTLTTAEVGKKIRLSISYTDALNTTGSPETVNDDASALNVAYLNHAPTGEVAVTGEAKKGIALTASNTLVDTDGIPTSGAGAIAYQWQSSSDGTNWLNISGANSTTFTLGEAQVGKQVRVLASYTDNQGALESKASSATGAVENVNDPVTGTVTITGTAKQGVTLSATNTLADLDGIPTSGAGAIAYQWQSSSDGTNWTNIDSATNATFTLGEAQVGKQVRVLASYTDNHGTPESKASSATGAVENVNDSVTGTVTITGTAKQGDMLSAANDLADLDGIPTSGAGAIAYQWQSSSDGTNWFNIGGANSTTFTLAEAQVGKQVRVLASYTDNHGTPESKASIATGAVENTNDAPVGGIQITGASGSLSTPSFEVGKTLFAATVNASETAVASLTDADNISSSNSAGTVSPTYTWYAKDSTGTSVSIGTGNSLVLTSAQVGKTISVVATYTDGHGTPETVSETSLSTTPVAWPTSISLGALEFVASANANASAIYGGGTGAGNNQVSSGTAKLIKGNNGDYILDVNGDGNINAYDTTTFLSKIGGAGSNGMFTITDPNTGTQYKLTLFSSTDASWNSLSSYAGWGSGAKGSASVQSADYWTSTAGTSGSITGSQHKVWSVDAGLYDKADAGSMSPNDSTRYHYSAFHVAPVI